MRIIETDFILKKTVDISKFGIKFRKINSKEKKQILDDLNKYLYNNTNIKLSKKYDISEPFDSIETYKFYKSLDEVNKEICLEYNLLLKSDFKFLTIKELQERLDHLIIIECNETILSEFIDKENITKFISNLLRLYGIYNSPLEFNTKVKPDYTFILESDFINRKRENYYSDLLLNFASSYKSKNNKTNSLKYVNINEEFLTNLKKLIDIFDKKDIRTFISSIDLMYLKTSTLENKIINYTSTIERLLISSNDNITSNFVLKAGLILKKYLKSNNDKSNESIKKLLTFCYDIRSCIVHGSEEKIIDKLDKLLDKDNRIKKICIKENNSYNNKLFNAYNISSMILYLTVCSIIKYWFDYPSELKYIKNN